MLLPACKRHVRSKLDNRSCTERIVSTCRAFISALFCTLRNLVNLIETTQMRISRAIDCATRELQAHIYACKNASLRGSLINSISAIELCRFITYSTDPCKHATFRRLLTKTLDSSMAHLCSLSFGIPVGCTDLTVMEIS